MQGVTCSKCIKDLILIVIAFAIVIALAQSELVLCGQLML